MTYIFKLPLHMTLPRKTKNDVKIPLSLNWYRNAHHTEASRVKALFEPISAELWELPPDRIKISYVVTKKTKARFDTMNFVSIVDKFFCDWLVNNGLLIDDDSSRVELGLAKGYAGTGLDSCTAIVETLNNCDLNKQKACNGCGDCLPW